MTNIEKLVEAQKRAQRIGLELREITDTLNGLHQRKTTLILEASELTGRIKVLEEIIAEDRKKAEEEAKAKSAPTT